MKKLTEKQHEAIKSEIKMMLHAARDTMRNHGLDTSKMRYAVSNNGSHGEAFGIIRALKILGNGEFGASNKEGTLLNFFFSLEDEVLREENFDGNNQCDWCLEHYGKDGSGRRARAVARMSRARAARVAA